MGWRYGKLSGNVRLDFPLGRLGIPLEALSLLHGDAQLAGKIQDLRNDLFHRKYICRDSKVGA